MDFKTYNDKALTTLTKNHEYGDLTAELMAQILGLIGESGEVAEKFKKLIRDKKGELSEQDKKEIIKELGDVLWYVNSVSNLLDHSLEDVAEINLEKVLSRKKRNKTHGSGDSR